jgi:arylsulfatase A-like enzyme
MHDTAETWRGSSHRVHAIALLHALLATAHVTAAAAGSAATKPPHLLVALVDDLGYSNVGFHNKRQRSPEIDRLATQEGVILEAMYTFRYCSPTRSSLLSGRFPLHVNQGNPRCVGTLGGIDLRMMLLPEKLKQAGYTTAMIGKGHLGARSVHNLPTNRGFDYHFGFLGGGEHHFTQRSYECPTGLITQGVPGVPQDPLAPCG